MHYGNSGLLIKNALLYRHSLQYTLTLGYWQQIGMLASDICRRGLTPGF